MRIAITGGLGYIGKVLYGQLRSCYGSEHTVLTVDERSSPSIPRRDQMTVDILDPDQIRRALKGVDLVIHLAAIPYVSSVNYDLERSEYINIEGTRNVVEAAKGAERLIFLSTSGIYGLQMGRLDEKSPVAPISEYGKQKLEGERIILSSGIHNVILRPSNLYGLGLDLPPGPLIHQMFRSALDRKTIEVSSTSAMRNFLHVSDCVKGISLICSRADVSGIFNIGHENLSLYNAARIIIECLQKRGMNIQIEVVDNGPPVMFDYVYDKIYRELGFEPMICLKDGLMEMIDHVKGPMQNDLKGG